MRLTQRLIVEEALEGEVVDPLGRERYARGEGEKAGYRNGYRTGKVQYGGRRGGICCAAVRETPEPFVSGACGAFRPHPGAQGSSGRARSGKRHPRRLRRSRAERARLL